MKFFKSILLSQAVFLSGCGMFSPTAQETFYYVLDDGAPSYERRGGALAVIGNVNMPSYLDSQSLILRKGEYEIIGTVNHRWAESLGYMLKSSASSNLGRHTNRVSVGEFCPGGKCFVLDFFFRDFSGNDQGLAKVAYSWSLKLDDKQRCQGDESGSQKLLSDGYPALVKALSRAWDDTLTSLGSKLDRCLASGRN